MYNICIFVARLGTDYLTYLKRKNSYLMKLYKKKKNNIRDGKKFNYKSFMSTNCGRLLSFRISHSHSFDNGIC